MKYQDQHYKKALERLKFEEFFIAQVRLQLVRLQRNAQSRGVVFEKVGSYFKEFYDHYLPFALTGAQKRVIKEIRHDTGRGKQMNRLLQGDVGSGKTMVLRVGFGSTMKLYASIPVFQRNAF